MWACWSLHLVNSPSFLHTKTSFVSLPVFGPLQLFQRQTLLDANSTFAAFSPVPGNLSSDHDWRSLEVESHHPVINIPLSEIAIQLFSRLLAISEKTANNLIFKEQRKQLIPVSDLFSLCSDVQGKLFLNFPQVILLTEIYFPKLKLTSS